MKRNFVITTLLLLTLTGSFILTGCQVIPGLDPGHLLPGKQAPTEEPTPVAEETIKPTATTEEVEETEEPVTEEPTEEVDTTPSPEPSATPTAAASEEAYQPLDSATCEDLADTMGQVLNVTIETGIGAFMDYVSGQSGSGCMASAAGTGEDFESQAAVADEIGDMLITKGWEEDVQYAADGPTGTAVGFKKDTALCLLDAHWEPAEDAECAPDKPIAECDVTPEQKLYRIILICANSEAAEGEPQATATKPAASATPVDEEVPPEGETETRIQFEPGNVSSVVEGSVAADGIDHYVVQAQADQTMMVNLVVPQEGAILAIQGEDGTVLLSESAATVGWIGLLPSSQDYYIDVKSTDSSAAYSLHVTITDSTPPTPGPQPQTRRIEFATGATSATEEGDLAGGAIARYVVGAEAGQTMTVDVASPEGRVILVIWGADGTVLISDHANATTWSGQLPLSQDYVIDAYNTGSQETGYSLTVTIQPALGPTPVPSPTPGQTTIPSATQIQFAPGTTSASIDGNLDASATDLYALNVTAGQTMNVSVSSHQENAILVIWGADGLVLISDHAGATTFSGPIPTTQAYYIAVTSTGEATAYQIEVSIPAITPTPSVPTRRIQFAAGGISASESGSLAAGAMDRYVLDVAAGQTLNVSISSPQGGVILVIWGADGTVLISDHAGATTWSGSIPSSQDYFIDVKSTGQAADYQLDVVIPAAEPTPAPTPAAAPKRIEFAPGTTSSVEAGNLVSMGMERYVLRAMAAQIMNVDVTSPRGEARLAVQGADGSIVVSDKTYWSGQLPATQDYYITVYTGSGETEYRLNVSIVTH